MIPKFRAWDILNKKMLNWRDIFDLPAWEIFPGTPEQRCYEVMQYTGIKNKNNKYLFCIGFYWRWVVLFNNTMKVNNIYHGDCLELMQHIPDKSIDMILCDLPWLYGTTACKWDTVIPLELLWEQYERVIKDNRAIVLFASQPFTTVLINSNIKRFRYSWVWEKEQGVNFLMAKRQPLKVHEDICVFSKKQTVYYPQMTEGKPYISGKGDSGEVTGRVKKVQTKNNGTRYPKSVIRFKRETGLHPTQKPVALLEYLIKTYTNEGETVLDNCMGSGSTGVACKNLNRNFIGIELDETYFNIARDRLNGINANGQMSIFTDVDKLDQETLF